MIFIIGVHQPYTFCFCSKILHILADRAIQTDDAPAHLAAHFLTTPRSAVFPARRRGGSNPHITPRFQIIFPILCISPSQITVSSNPHKKRKGKTYRTLPSPFPKSRATLRQNRTKKRVSDARVGSAFRRYKASLNGMAHYFCARLTSVYREPVREKARSPPSLLPTPCSRNRCTQNNWNVRGARHS